MLESRDAWRGSMGGRNARRQFPRGASRRLKPIDGGHFIFDEAQRADFLQRESGAHEDREARAVRILQTEPLDRPALSAMTELRGLSARRC
jgi:hypothetical protein